MKKAITTILFCALFATQMFSQTSTTEEELKTDLVTIADGKYKMDILRLITDNGKSIQLKAHSECTQTAISRDNFVFMTTNLIFKMIDDLTPETAVSSDLDELIGNPDI